MNDRTVTFVNETVISGGINPKTNMPLEPIVVPNIRCTPLPYMEGPQNLTIESEVGDLMVDWPVDNFCIESPLVRILPYTDGWELATKAVFNVWSMHIVVPKDFPTDFATIPQMFQNLIKVNGKHRLAALMHDYLYSIKGQLPTRVLTRKQCDLAFLQGMKASNVKWLKRNTMYRLVRWCGGKYWSKK